MGKVELKLEVDAEIAHELDARGIDVSRVAEVSLKNALETARR